MALSGNGFQSGGYNMERSPSGISSSDNVDTTAIDPASNSFLSGPDMKKHEDLKEMLDNKKDSLKLEAMKRIIGMVAKGKDASDLFPAVVKNVVCKNLEVKKLVYVYLTRYAEEQQDLALLSISTFQRALKDPNQLIRASALRVLSSIRVSVIIPIMMLAIKDGCSDMSPYVRKTAAHAIPKLYSLDPDQKEELITVIEKLLADKTTLVAGSVIAAFEEVCPERIDLIHKNYRKLCGLLMDVDEWGQVSIINMLTRYARTQFINPQGDMKSDKDMTDPKNFYEEKDSSESEKEDDEESKNVYVMDQDHRTLLRASKPLLNSRNAAVVLAVAQLYYHCAPSSEVGTVSKALIRLLRGHKETQYLVLCNILSMTADKKGMFEPYMKSFYVRSSDPLQVKMLKLEILTNIANEANISTVLREFQTYVKSSDADFAAATIQGIGRCASSIPEVTEACLNGLVRLLSNRNEAVVAESVVVIKKLLQMQREELPNKKPSEHKDIIAHLATLVDKITVPAARASILWLLGEYCDRVPKIAPDVLRKTAKTFIQEEDIVKLQVLNLAAKLFLTNAKQTRLLCQYVLQLAKYDLNYDIRDRARFLKALLFPAEGAAGAQLARYAKKILLSSKPAPLLSSKFQERETYQLATLSHVLNAPASGYTALPDWPEVAPDPSVRQVEVPQVWAEPSSTKPPVKKKSFYSDDESSSEEESSSGSEDSESDSESEDEGSDSTDQSEQSSDESEQSSEEEEDSSEEEQIVPVAKKNPIVAKPASSPSGQQDSTSGEESDSEESSEESDSSQDSEPPPPPVKSTKKSKKVNKGEAKTAEPQKAMDLLLDLDFGPSSGGVTPMQTTTLQPTSSSIASSNTTQQQPTGDGNLVLGVSPGQVALKTHELLNRMTGKGLQILYRFPRTVSVFEPRMVTCELTFSNNGDDEVKNIHMGEKKLQKNMNMEEFAAIASLAPTNQTKTSIGIDFADTTQAAAFDLCTESGSWKVSISAPVGELLQPHTMTEKEFIAERGKLTGMTETTGTIELATATDNKSVVTKVYQAANVSQVSGSGEELIFCGRTASSKTLCLLSLKADESKQKWKVRVNCEMMVVCSMLLKELKASFSN